MYSPAGHWRRAPGCNENGTAIALYGLFMACGGLRDPARARNDWGTVWPSHG